MIFPTDANPPVFLKHGHRSNLLAGGDLETAGKRSRKV